MMHLAEISSVPYICVFKIVGVQFPDSAATFYITVLAVVCNRAIRSINHAPTDYK